MAQWRVDGDGADADCSRISHKMASELSLAMRQHCRSFSQSSDGTSEPVKDGDICIFKFSTPAMCCSACMAGHEEVHARLAAWQAVAAMIVV
ncbi:hypothetical protein GBF38_019253 [Nibea albiflora]|uniref:Uncharacterized protein n=1 Tax=Nibea albiflora TaxID=240163 RepID=A0ACB7F571_NIBAL|nr:hypothetical protein GBF38_019253 [Nibea albiflora]